MIKKYSLVFIALLCSFFYGFGQVKIAELTFETAGGYTTSVVEFTDGAEIRIYCTDWSKEISFKDSLKVIASSGKLLDWINKEAYD